jgi:two-component system, chemotaxis family, sensor kinase CheA
MSGVSGRPPGPVMDEILREFLTETSDSIESVDRELVRFEREPNNETVLAHIFRLVHTIKGTCGFLGLPRLEALSHAAESMISRFREGSPVTADAVSLTLSTIDRIKEILRALEETEGEPEGDDADLIRHLEKQVEDRRREAAAQTNAQAFPISIVGGRIEAPPRPPEPEQPPPPRAEPQAESRPAPALPRTPAEQVRSAVSAGNRAGSPGVQSIRVGLDTLESLMTMVSELVLTRNQLIEIARRSENTDFKVPLQRLSSVTAELQERVMKTRMQPISSAWQKLPRLARDLATELNKEIELELSGGDTELDRQVLELVKDPFTHLLRNAADHGIEPPGERLLKGKPARGTIRVSATHESGTIAIEVADDGRGLDIARVAAKALERGLVTPSELDRMTEERIARFIFEPGFTTVSKVSHVSGRGVGMDVVRSNIELIGGTVDVRWTPGQGSVLTMKIPLTLAIVAALIVEVGGQRFAIPQPSIIELVQARTSTEQRLSNINGQALLRLREQMVPVVKLGAVLGPEMEKRAGAVDEGFIVVMKVGKRTFGVTVDVVYHTEEIVVKPMSGLLRAVSIYSGNTILGDGTVILILDPNGLVSRIGDAPTPSRSDADEKPAVRKRLHEEKSSVLVFRAGRGELKAVPLAAVTRLEEVDARKIETVGGRSVAQYRGDLIPIIPASESMAVRTEGIQPVLVFSEGDRTAGLAVDEIVDIVEEYLDIRTTGQGPGIIGSAIIRGHATEIIDVAHFLPFAYPDWFEDPAPRRREISRRVLLVDGAPFFRGMLVPVLKAAGYEVVALAEVEAALTLLRRGDTFDVIIADVESPAPNGFTLAELMQGDHHLRDVPVIGLASRRRDDLVERGHALGLAEFVAKFDREGLIVAIGEIVDARELAA